MRVPLGLLRGQGARASPGAPLLGEAGEEPVDAARDPEHRARPLLRQLGRLQVLDALEPRDRGGAAARAPSG